MAQWVKNLPAIWRHGRHGLDPWVGTIPWRRKWQPTPAFLPEKSHRQRSLAGYSPKCCKESDVTERLSTISRIHFCFVSALSLGNALTH